MSIKKKADGAMLAVLDSMSNEQLEENASLLLRRTLDAIAAAAKDKLEEYKGDNMMMAAITVAAITNAVVCQSGLRAIKGIGAELRARVTEEILRT